MKAFRDPVHNIIYFDKEDDELLLELIDTKEFQRLRHIQQLGVSSFTYPGATHTRFAHSLGVTHLMKRFINKILQINNPIIPEYLEELNKNKTLAVVSALLHDIGHGPFSHAIEEITGIDHEDFSIAIIRGNTEINRILESVYKGFSDEVSNVIRRTHTSSVVVRLLSSQLDVDRIDYLLRDSKMTGAGYGSFDIEWLINVLRIGKYNNQIEVGLDLNKGLSIAEDFVLARYYMHKHVYFHKATRGVEVMIKQILSRVKELNEEGKLTLNPHLKVIFLNNKKDLTGDMLHSFLLLTDNTIWNNIYEWSEAKDSILSNLCINLLRRRLYKSIESPNDPVKQVEFIQKANNIAGREGKKLEEILILDNPSTSYYKDDYFSYTVKDDEFGEEKEASERILLFDSTGESFELSTKSSIINIIRNERIIVSRFYFPPEFYDEFLGG